MAIEESLISTKYLEPAIWVICAWLVRELYSSFVKRSDNQDTSTDRNTAAILTLEKSLIAFQGQISLLSEQIRPLARLPDDIAKAHQKIREIEKKL